MQKDTYYDEVDAFVNGNKASAIKIRAKDFDKVDDETAYPVILYYNNSKLAAWYDIENKVGYIAK
jgi:hypothetical protein